MTPPNIQLNGPISRPTNEAVIVADSQTTSDFVDESCREEDNEQNERDLFGSRTRLRESAIEVECTGGKHPDNSCDVLRVAPRGRKFSA